jgi:alcohol dehydrogenase
MNQLKKLFYRIYQRGLYIASCFLPINEPAIISGEDSLSQLAKQIKFDQYKKAMIITQVVLHENGLIDELLLGLKSRGVEYILFDRTIPNPTIAIIEEAKALYVASDCDCLIALGGGSAMDLAKGVGALIARPKKTLRQMKGLLKVNKRIPTLYAVPTTSGTGSEATLACVVTDGLTKEKYAINDPVLIPKYAILSPKLTIGLPKEVTSTTGMDALTHAVEAFIGKSNTRKTKRFATEAVQLIFSNLLTAYNEPDNLIARNNMQLAAYKAGVAFTRAYVGNVHAVAHTLGGMYHIPHGLANAVILPHILEYYNSKVDHKLSILADAVELTDASASEHDKAKAFIDAIVKMNAAMSIPANFGDTILSEDIPLMIKRAKAEANPLYPVPVIMDDKAFLRIYSLLQD